MRRIGMILPGFVTVIAIISGVVSAMSVMGVVGVVDAGAAAPVKLILVSRFGREVNKTEVAAKGGPALEDVCTVASKDECQSGKESNEPGGFEFPEGVAVAADGGVYVADRGNRHVQVLDP